MSLAKRITPLALSKMNKPGRYAVGDGAYLQISASGTRSWVFRYSIAGKAAHMGLGAYPTVSLAEARQKAQEARKQILDGKDPLGERKQAKAKRQAEEAGRLTFEDCAKQFISTQKVSWRNDKHKAQWASTLETYCYPRIGKVPVKDIDSAMVLSVLQQPVGDDKIPLWEAKPETASRLRGRIEAVLDRGRVLLELKSPNPAAWKGALSALLPKRSKVRKVASHPAMPFSEIASFMAVLREKEGTSARALEFLILTATRTGEVIGATWDEIDLEAKVWTIPPERMKAGRPHRVPLSDRAVKLLGKLPRTGDYLFGGRKEGKPLSNMALLELMRDMSGSYVPHGFRSTFRDWAGEVTHHPREVAEAALAHIIGDKAEQAYRRGDALEKRRALMQDWAAYCGGGNG